MMSPAAVLSMNVLVSRSRAVRNTTVSAPALLLLLVSLGWTCSFRNQYSPSTPGAELIVSSREDT